MGRGEGGRRGGEGLKIAMNAPSAGLTSDSTTDSQPSLLVGTPLYSSFSSFPASLHAVADKPPSVPSSFSCPRLLSLPLLSQNPSSSHPCLRVDVIRVVVALENLAALRAHQERTCRLATSRPYPYSMLLLGLLRAPRFPLKAHARTAPHEPPVHTGLREHELVAEGGVVGGPEGERGRKAM